MSPDMVRSPLTRDGHSAGIEQSEEMKRFLWDNHFAAIASDMPSLEVRSLSSRPTIATAY